VLLNSCSGSEAGSYLRIIDFVCHSTLGFRVIKKKQENLKREDAFVGAVLKRGALGVGRWTDTDRLVAPAMPEATRSKVWIVVQGSS